MQLTPFFSKLGRVTAPVDSAEPSQLLRGRGEIWNQGYLSLNQCFKPLPRGRATSEGEKQHRKDQVLTFDASTRHMASTAGPQETLSGGSYTIPPLEPPVTDETEIFLPTDFTHGQSLYLISVPYQVPTTCQVARRGAPGVIFPQTPHTLPSVETRLSNSV